MGAKATARGAIAALLGAAVSVGAWPALTPASAGLGPSGCAPAAHPGGDWPLYGKDITNSRHQGEEAEIDASTAPLLAPEWRFSSEAAGGEGDFSGTPVVAGGCVYVGSNLGWAFALNADTGDLVWKTQLAGGGTINSALAVDDGRVFAFVSRVDKPYVVALDAESGAPVWATTVDRQKGSDAFASPSVFDGMVFVGVSGDAAQHAESEKRVGFHGSFVVLDADTGRILTKTWTIPRSEWRKGFAGATVSTTPAIDAGRRLAYVGTSSPYRPQAEHRHANSLLQIDLDRASDRFGHILRAYKGDTFDAVVPGYSQMPCYDLPIPPPPPIVPTGRGVGACGDVDVDFATAPNLVSGPRGEMLIASSQKSGSHHAADATTMEPVWRTTYGPAQPFGGVAAAYDGSSLFGGGAPPGYLYSLDAQSGRLRWVAAVGDGAHYGIPVASANGVVYTVDVRGFLDAYDAATGVPLLHRPMLTETAGHGDVSFTFGGVSVARNRVYATVGVQNTGLDATGSYNGYVIAFGLS